MNIYVIDSLSIERKKKPNKFINLAKFNGIRFVVYLKSVFSEQNTTDKSNVSHNVLGPARIETSRSVSSTLLIKSWVISSVKIVSYNLRIKDENI